MPSSRIQLSADDVQTGAADAAKTEDAHFEERYGAVESVITSTGRGDSGTFETSLGDVVPCRPILKMDL